jgi:hypothetical protein
MRQALSDEREATLSAIGLHLLEIEKRAKSLERTKERAQQFIAEPSSAHGVEWDTVPDLTPCAVTDRIESAIEFAIDQASIDNALYAVERIRLEDELSFSISFFASLI